MRQVLVAVLASLLLAGAWLLGVPALAQAPTIGPAPGSAPVVVATVDRHALLLANADYPGESRDLANPVNDARMLARTLAGLGFQVTLVENADRSAMRRAVDRFADGLPANATALVYYAGHGAQIGGSNFLLPTDTRLRSEAATAIEAYPLKSLLERLAAARSAVNVVVLDACRNNPFQPPPGSRMRSWNVDGLARAIVPSGTLIAYSTAPGEVAADGSGEHSLFATALSRELARTGQPLEQSFKRAGAWVRQQTRDEQIPWIESSLTADFYLQPPPGVTSVAASRGFLAQAPRSVVRTGQRGGAPEALWYAQMTPPQWAELEWSVQQRVKRLTPDELPGLERKARAGSVVAMTTLGLAHREGIQRSVNGRLGTIRSPGSNTQALRWLGRASDAGFPMAQAELAEMYFLGHGVDRDPARTHALLQAAAANGYPRATLDLAHLELMQNPSPASAMELGRSLSRLLKTAPPMAVPPNEQRP